MAFENINRICPDHRLGCFELGVCRNCVVSCCERDIMDFSVCSGLIILSSRCIGCCCSSACRGVYMNLYIYKLIHTYVQAWGNHWSLLSSIAGPCPSMGQSLVFAIFECWPMSKHGAVTGLCHLRMLAHVQAWGNHWSLPSSNAGPTAAAAVTLTVRAPQAP